MLHQAKNNSDTSQTTPIVEVTMTELQYNDLKDCFHKDLNIKTSNRFEDFVDKVREFKLDPNLVLAEARYGESLYTVVGMNLRNSLANVDEFGSSLNRIQKVSEFTQCVEKLIEGGFRDQFALLELGAKRLIGQQVRICLKNLATGSDEISTVEKRAEAVVKLLSASSALGADVNALLISVDNQGNFEKDYKDFINIIHKNLTVEKASSFAKELKKVGVDL
jgi:hypothetical protein